MTLIFKNNFNNILKQTTTDKIINKSELEMLQNAAQSRDEKFFTKLLTSSNIDNVKIKFKVQETAIKALNYDVQVSLSDTNNSGVRSYASIDLSNHEIISVPDHKPNDYGKNVPEQVYQDFPNLRVLGNILKVEDYDNLLVRKNVEDLAKLPERTLLELKNKGLKQIQIGNVSVVDMAKNSDLVNQKPRNWSEGSSWNEVPGVYNPRDRTVAIGVGSHGSEALAIHEVGHAIGDLFKLDKSKEMVEHHKRLFNKVEEYLKGGDEGGNRAGLEEMFAEALATLLDDGEEKAIQRFDKPLVDYIKREVFNNQPLQQKSNKSDVYQDLISRIDIAPDKNDNYQNLMTTFDS